MFSNQKMMLFKSTFPQIWSGIVKVSLLLILVPFFVLSFYNHPVYDDYGNAYKTIKYGFWGVQKILYHDWTGRYFSSLLLTVANPLSYNWPEGVRFTPIFFMTLILFAIYVLLAYLLNGIKTKSYILWVSISVFVLYLYAMPQVFQGFFWYTGAAVYQVGSALVIFTLLASAKHLSTGSSTPQKLYWSSAAILMGMATAATNEVALLQLLGIVGLCFLVCLYRKNSAWKWWLLLGATILIAAFFAIVAPGNFVRIAAMSDPHAKSIAYSIPRTVFTGIELVTRPVVWISMLLILIGWAPLGYKIASRNKLQFLTIHPIVGLVFLFALTSFCYFPFWWIWAAYTPVRTENAIVFFLLIGWLVWVQSTIVWFIRSHVQSASMPSWLTGIAVPIFGIILVFKGVAVPAWLELVTNASRYNTHLNQRTAYIKQQKKKNKISIIVQPLVLNKAYGILTDGSGLSADSTAGPNVSVASYYDLVSVRAASSDGVVVVQNK